jgi:hypothetical protein
MDVKYDRAEGKLAISHASYLSTFFASLPWYTPKRQVTPARVGSQLKRREAGDTPTYWWTPHFRKCIGAMAHVSHWTFPELPLTTSMCSQYMSDPGPEHRDYLVRILDYVHTNKEAVRLFTRSPGAKLRACFGFPLASPHSGNGQLQGLDAICSRGLRATHEVTELLKP